MNTTTKDRRSQGAGHALHGRPARTARSGRDGVTAITLGGRNAISTSTGQAPVLVGRRVRIKDRLLHGGYYGTVASEDPLQLLVHPDDYCFPDGAPRLVCYTPDEVDPVALTVARRAA